MRIYRLEETDISYKQIVDLLHESFEERLEQGLRFTCSFMTEEQYKERTKDGIIFVAIDEEYSKFVGTAFVKINHKKGKKYGYNEYCAISSDYKNKGIGSLLEKRILLFCKESGCSYILTDTSVNAVSSVRFHLKNGFKIIGLESYRSTNYWSYVFRLQLEPSFLWNNSLFIKLHYWISYAFIKMTRDVNGNDTLLGKIYKKTKIICGS